MRSVAIALVLIGCGSAQSGAASSTPSGADRAGACEPFVLPGISGDGSSDAECVPPEQLGASESATRWRQSGRVLEAGNCFVTAYEESSPSDAWLAFQAARAYHEADQRDLSRHWYERVIATSTDEQTSAEARRGLAALDEH